MPRPERHEVDYFPFFVKEGRTLFMLQHTFGLEGIGFFTNLFRFLSTAPDHHFCIADPFDALRLFETIGVEEPHGIEMLEVMVKSGKLDRRLWGERRAIASADFLESLSVAYAKRSSPCMSMQEIYHLYGLDDTEPKRDAPAPKYPEANQNPPKAEQIEDKPEQPEAPAVQNAPEATDIVDAWYGQYRAKTGAPLRPTKADRRAAQAAETACGKDAVLSAIGPYFGAELWYTKSGYSFGAFCKHLPELLSIRSPPTDTRRPAELCPVCGRPRAGTMSSCGACGYEYGTDAEQYRAEISADARLSNRIAQIAAMLPAELERGASGQRRVYETGVCVL